MKKNISVVLLLMTLLIVPACSGEAPDAQRLTALEAEVKALKQETEVRDKVVREELALVRRNLENIRALLEIDRDTITPGPGVPPESPSSGDQDLDKKAKTFVDENLNRLMEMTRKLLDKMEKELDEHLKKTEPAPPQGDQI